MIDTHELNGNGKRLAVVGVRNDVTITANTIYPEVSMDNSTFDRKYEGSSGIARSLYISTKGLYDMNPADNACYSRYLRFVAASNVSATSNYYVHFVEV